MKLIPVKPFRQSEAFCGPASLKMVLAYYGVSVTEAELGRLAKTSRRFGTPAKNLLVAARKFGFKGVIKDEASLQDIKKYLKQGIPVIVNWFSTDEGHYSVAVGIDSQNIYLQDPEIARIRKMDCDTFVRIWFDFPGGRIKDRRDIVLRRLLVVFPQ